MKERTVLHCDLNNYFASVCRLLFGDGRQIAERIQKEIKSELKITVSVGVSFNKVFTKLGSDMKNRMQ